MQIMRFTMRGCAFSLAAVLFGLVSFIPQPVSAYTIIDSGNLLSNTVLRNSSSMNESTVQAFLNDSSGNCTNICLKNFTESGQSAARIISDAAVAYTVNPQVLLAILQAQTGVVTSNNPSPALLSAAAGYPNVTGFANQVQAAASFINDRYLGSPATPVNYTVGIFSIPWSTNIDCGGSLVDIKNEATAIIYSYPSFGYQPNAAAINAVYEQGDACSSYGVRNFTNYLNDWFLNPPPPSPVYRLTNYITGERLFTKSAIEVSVAVERYPGWKYEGIAFTAAPGYDSNATPVYRLTNYYMKARLFTTSKFEADYAVATYPGWVYEGQVFSAYSAQREGTVPVYRLVNKIYGGRLFTTSKFEADYAVATYPGWVYEGPIAFYSYQ